jgi:hypothetical protein
VILSLPLRAKKVLVIDDEINGITLEVALNEGQDLFNELRDINSPTTDEITNIINSDFNEYANLIENQNFSLKLIQNVFMYNRLIRNGGNDNVLDYLNKQT